MNDLFASQNAVSKRGTKTMSKTTTNVTVADAVAQAAEEKLVNTVPQQSDNTKENENVSENTGAPTLEVVDGEDKKTLGQRLDAGIEKLKKHRKVVLGVGASLSVAAIAFAKFAKKQVDEVIIETTVVTTETESNTENDGDENAA